MTLTLGMYYNNERGALIASDSRGLREYEIERPTQKIFKINNTILSFSGTVFLRDGLLEKLAQKSKEEKMRDAIVEAYSEMIEYYTAGENPLIKKKKFECDGVLGFWEQDKPKLFCVDSKGIFNEICEFEARGQGWNHASKILRGAYKKDISKEEAIQMAVYCIIESSKYNCTVDDVPQIALIEKKRCTILNQNKQGEFIFENAKIMEIKKRMETTFHQHQTALQILLGKNKNAKEGLIKILEEFEGNKLIE
jgi:20S proteasome alpha/beta subunit